LSSLRSRHPLRRFSSGASRQVAHWRYPLAAPARRWSRQDAPRYQTKPVAKRPACGRAGNLAGYPVSIGCWQIAGICETVSAKAPGHPGTPDSRW